MTSQPETGVAAGWGLRCPGCGDSAEIDIAATVWVRLCPNGTDTALAPYGDHEWADDSAASCNACGYRGLVRDFRTAGGNGGGP